MSHFNRSLLIAATFGLALQAHAAPVIPKIKVVETSGMGCHDKAPAEELIINDKGFAIDFNADILEQAGTPSPLPGMNSCRVRVEITMPAGKCYALEDFSYRGEVDLADKGSVFIKGSPYIEVKSGDQWVQAMTYSAMSHALINGPLQGKIGGTYDPDNMYASGKLRVCQPISRLTLDYNFWLGRANNDTGSWARLSWYSFRFSVNDSLLF